MAKSSSNLEGRLNLTGAPATYQRTNRAPHPFAGRRSRDSPGKQSRESGERARCSSEASTRTTEATLSTNSPSSIAPAQHFVNHSRLSGLNPRARAHTLAAIVLVSPAVAHRIMAHLAEHGFAVFAVVACVMGVEVVRGDRYV